MFTHEDLVKFYKLLLRYNPTSNNIGVIDKNKFKEIYEITRKEYKAKPNVRIMMNQDKNKFTILDNGLETTYILIEKDQDMIGRFFRKYI